MARPASRLSQLERALVQAETRLALIDSLTPVNYQSEVVRLTSAFEAGQLRLPHFRFLPEGERRRRADLVSATLTAAQLALSDCGFQKELTRGLAELLHERIEEIRFEAQMVRECGGADFRRLAGARYRFETSELQAAQDLATSWSGLEVEVEPPQEEVLLASAFEEKRRKLGEWSERVMIAQRNLASLCGVGGHVVYVQEGALVDRLEVERLWVHEVEGHLLPRLHCEKQPAPFSIGTPGCVIDEEGRAVWLEERAGLLHSRRRRELGVRYLLAHALREAGDEGVLERVLVEKGRGIGSANLARAVCRIYRGGGMGREVIYLPGYRRVKMAFEERPDSEQYFQKGRASVAALPFFRETVGLSPSLA